MRSAQLERGGSPWQHHSQPTMPVLPSPNAVWRLTVMQAEPWRSPWHLWRLVGRRPLLLPPVAAAAALMALQATQHSTAWTCPLNQWRQHLRLRVLSPQQR